MKKHSHSFVVGFLLLSLVFNPFTTHSQAITENRIEFEHGEDYESYELMPIGDKGFILFAKEVKSDVWKSELYNTNLEFKKKVNYEVPRGYTLKETYSTDEYQHLFYRNMNGDFTLLSFSVDDLTMKTNIGKLPRGNMFFDMVAEGNIAFIATLEEKKYMLMKLNIETGESSISEIEISADKSSKIDYEGMQLIKEDKTLFIYLNTDEYKKYDLFVIQFDYRGKQISELCLSNNTEKILTTITASFVDEGEYIFTGGYTTLVNTYSYTEGIYLCKITNQSIDFIKMHYIPDFSEFFTYSNTQFTYKVEKKIKKANKKNKQISFNWLLVEHPIQKIRENYAFIGEFYYPTYQRTGSGNSSNLTFTGNLHTHCLIASFDPEGNQIWNESFSIVKHDKPDQQLTELVSSKVEDEIIVLFYECKDVILNTEITPDGNILNNESKPFTLNGNYESVKTNNSITQLWFDRNFISFGYQSINDNKESNTGKNRTIFFISKVTF